MGTFVVDLLSGKPLLLNKTFGIASGSTIPVWGGITGDILNQVDLQNQFDTKVNNSFFTGYSATTYEILSDLELNKLEISAFTTYSAETKNRIDYFINDYDSNYKTEAEILALSPSAYTNQKFWATDTKVEYVSKYVETTSGHSWLQTSINYDPITDSYYLGTSVDGQTTNIGQETFLNCINRNTENVSTLNPKVFVVLNTDNETSSSMSTILGRANDISDSSIYGVNTTSANVGQYYKLLTYGLLNAVNTSNWPVGTELFISTTIRGELTSIKPIDRAISVGRVLKQGATDGVIFVNTIRSTENISTLYPTVYDYTYFNADLITTSAGTFYLNLRNDKGTLSAATQIVSVADNSISGLTRDSLSIVFPTNISYPMGGYLAKIDVSVSIAPANEKIYLEVYKANEYGNPIDSGFDSQIIGDLGVKPLAVLSSGILDLPANTLTGVVLEGILQDGVVINKGERFRFHIKCEKIGSQGGNKIFTIYYGSIYNSYLRFPHYAELDELFDVVVSDSVSGNFLKKTDTGIWIGDNIQMSDVSGLTGYTASTKILIDTKQNKVPELSNVNVLSYSATTNDEIIGINATTGSSVNIYLLPISVTGILKYIIKDQGFNAAINNINIFSSSGDYLENGQTSVSIGINGGSISIYNNGLNNWFIF